MALNSFTFLLAFLPALVVGVFLLRDHVSQRAAQVLLLIASIGFYSLDGIWDLSLLLFSITFNWSAAKRIGSPELAQPQRKKWLVFALVVDVSVLCFYKYARAVEGMAGLADALPPIGFPLGISFFTLTQVMYLVDCYERLVPAKSWFDHATFVSLFSNVTAGPLLRGRLFYAQLENLGSKVARNERLTRGMTLVALGLLKKVVIGDSFAQVTNAGFDHAGELSMLGAWVTVFADSFEIYFDFSGYSDMAYGCAELLGLQLTRNFDIPYKSATISEFWRRWHISLSDFITTYLYTPILRRMGKATLHTSAVAAVTAMLIAGVWHGASWNFVVFGAMHGSALAVFQYWKKLKRPMPRPLDVFVTFVFVSVTFLTVRSPDIATTMTMAAELIPRGEMFDLSPFWATIPMSDFRMLVVPILFGCVTAFVGPKAEQLALRPKPGFRSDLVIIALLLVAYMYMDAREVTIFRYRQF